MNGWKHTEDECGIVISEGGRNDPAANHSAIIKIRDTDGREIAMLTDEAERIAIAMLKAVARLEAR